MADTENKSKSKPDQKLCCTVCSSALNKDYLTTCGHSVCASCLGKKGKGCPECLQSSGKPETAPVEQNGTLNGMVAESPPVIKTKEKYEKDIEAQDSKTAEETMIKEDLKEAEDPKKTEEEKMKESDPPQPAEEVNEDGVNKKTKEEKAKKRTQREKTRQTKKRSRKR